MTIYEFISDHPSHPLTSLFEMLEDDQAPNDDIATTKGMAAGMVVLLAHLNQLSRIEAINLLEEIGPPASAPANNPAPGAIH